MAWLWLRLPHFAATAARIQAALPLGAAVVVAEGGRVRDCSPEPWARGVRPGLALREALTRCPGAHIGAWEPARARELWERLAARLRQLGPDFEARAWETFALTTLPGQGEALPAVQAALAQARALTIPVQAGWSAGRFVASAAAQAADPGQACLVAPGCEPAFLAPLPLGQLPLSADVLEELRVLGLRTVGDFARLPSAAVGIRFGNAGLHAWRLARGEERPLPVAREPERPSLDERATFDPPLEWDGALAAALQQSLARLGASLEARGLACTEVGLQLGGEAGRTWRAACRLSEPTGSTAGMAGLAGPLLAQLVVRQHDSGNYDAPMRQHDSCQDRCVAALDAPGGERIAELRLWARGASPGAAGQQLSLFAAAGAGGKWRQDVLEVAARYPDCFWQGRRLDPDARLARQRAVWQPWIDPEAR